ncbi:hypothetical protein ABT294_00445 [Nonomuraea sp. NPDC000554]|uniref:hypothetical protein n=1 Tax=Nonomuraea sp. NPDC000554 TaxID=3154259 RepID=UPI00333034EC
MSQEGRFKLERQDDGGYHVVEGSLRRTASAFKPDTDWDWACLGMALAMWNGTVDHYTLPGPLKAEAVRLEIDDALLRTKLRIHGFSLWLRMLRGEGTFSRWPARPGVTETTSHGPQ